MALSAGAVGRRAAAHRHRPGARQRSAARARRRADRQPRSRPVARDHEPVPRDQRPRHDGARRHPRSRADPPRRPPGAAPRAGPRRREARREGAALCLARRRSRSLWRGRRALLLSMATIAVALVVLGAFRVVSANLARVADGWRTAAEMSVYLDDVVTRGGADRRPSADRAQPGAWRASPSSRKEEALARFGADFPELGDITGVARRQPVPGVVRGAAAHRRRHGRRRAGAGRRRWPRCRASPTCATTAMARPADGRARGAAHGRLGVGAGAGARRGDDRGRRRAAVVRGAPRRDRRSCSWSARRWRSSAGRS